MDLYVIHRRPKLNSSKIERCFIRLSFTPIEIKDINNTLNPLIPQSYKTYGVVEFRDKLEYYDKKELLKEFFFFIVVE